MRLQQKNTLLFFYILFVMTGNFHFLNKKQKISKTNAKNALDLYTKYTHEEKEEVKLK